ncbi:immune-associated nucleotide-binding protein 1-like isoform X1 [Papaver somniferum]|uniref:immune-associated nucleotide-binding protein 1-like isoform X1 n=1 Tax=Papaver somniferum TaxID=3469 RepID=UPI000E6F6BD9|nr:immune-associated nucleotide-binding protein 1-like isoform X1 [Papaver somniferum]
MHIHSLVYSYFTSKPIAIFFNRRMAGTSNTVPTFTEPINLVLFGRVGNGKSSLGNSIIRKTAIKNGQAVSARAFEAKAAASGVTSECKMETTTLHDGQVVTVIDTPGIFDTEVGVETLQKEIVKCMHMTTDGIHGFLLVFSFRTRFSEEEAHAITYLKFFFGDDIVNYMIVVFTGADELEDDEITPEGYFCTVPQALKDVMELCNNRVVIFDNKTKDENIRIDQVQRLTNSVKEVLAANGGKPFTNEFFEELKREASLRPETVEHNLNMYMLFQQRIAEINNAITKRFEETIERIKQDLENERCARKESEEKMLLDLEYQRSSRKQLEEKMLADLEYERSIRKELKEQIVDLEYERSARKVLEEKMSLRRNCSIQ